MTSSGMAVTQDRCQPCDDDSNGHESVEPKPRRTFARRFRGGAQRPGGAFGKIFFLPLFPL
jgi:hypothetical protein